MSNESIHTRIRLIKQQIVAYNALAEQRLAAKGRKDDAARLTQEIERLMELKPIHFYDDALIFGNPARYAWECLGREAAENLGIK